MKKPFEYTIDFNCSLEAAVEHFADILSGKLDAYLEDEDASFNHTHDSYSGEMLFGDGTKLQVDVYTDGESWRCEAK